MRVVLWPALLLGGCPWIGGDRLAERYDPDGDGVLWPDDCDDRDASVATEGTWPVDADGDGFGDPVQTVTACHRPDDAVDNTDDCDDGDEAIGLPSAWWPDVDQDTFGDPAGEVIACVAPAGTIVPGDPDCDDSREFVKPGATEICDNGLDDDCDGTPNDCALLGDLDAWLDPWVTVLGSRTLDAIGASMSVGDANGDGAADLALSVRGGSGAVALLHGGPLGPWDPHDGTSDVVDLFEEAEALWAAPPGHTQYGNQVRLIGGLMNGQTTLVVGASGDDPVGGSYAGALLFYPGAVDPTPALVVHGAYADALGFSVDDLGATDGSGPDLGFSLFRDGGEVRIVDGPVTATGDIDVDDFLPRMSLKRGGTIPWFTSLGLGLASVDLDDDGVREILVSDPFNGGGVWVIPGDGSGTLVVDEYPAVPDPDTTGLGWSIASAGDFDGDGYEDAVLGAPYHEAVSGDQRGAVRLLWGSASGAGQLDTLLIEGEEGANLGIVVTGLGDLDHDGFSDVAWAAGGGSTQMPSGDVRGFYGGDRALNRSARISPLSLVEGGESILDLAHGDLDGDGTDDLVVPDFPPPDPAGAVHVFRGIGG